MTVGSVDRFGHDHEFTKLIVDLKGKDPDDAFSSVPYEKVICSFRKIYRAYFDNVIRVSISFTT